MMTKLLEEIEKLVHKELHLSNCDHPPVFNSDHEAWAVVKEEVDEAEYELEHLLRQSDLAWFNIKNNDQIILSERFDGWIPNAMHLAAEAIQVAAMLVKWRNTLAIRRAEVKVDAMEEKYNEAETKLARSAWDDNPFGEEN